ncbi:unnamed protein product [Closterium sp. Naga37s-1]|nr:unnamed protein product [Closterium sp. Naga37s-1]
MAQNPSAPTSSLEPPSLLVVGAGPVGLVAACELRRHGLHVRVVERNRAPSEHSKALALHARTLEILSAHDGVVDALIAAGTIVEGIEVRTDGHLAASLAISELNGGPAGDDGKRHGRDHGMARREEQSVNCGDDSRPSVWATQFPFVLMVPQSDTERILARCLKDVYGTDVEWQTELVRIRQDPSAVHVELRHAHGRTGQRPTPATPSHSTAATAAATGTGTANRETRRETDREEWRAVEEGGTAEGEVEVAAFDLVCACDGPHSTCRRQLGLSFDGLQYPMHALLADVALSHWPFPRNKGHVFTRGKRVVAPGVGGRGGGGGGGGVLVALPFGVNGLWRLIFDEGTARRFSPPGLIDQTEARRQGKGKAAEGGGTEAGERTGRGGDKSETPYVEIPAGISSSVDVSDTTEVPPPASDTPSASTAETLSTAGVTSPAVVSETAHHGPATIPSAPLPSTPPSAASASSLTADGSGGDSADTAPSSSPVTAQQPALTPQHVSAMLNAIVPCGAHVDSIHWCSVFSMHLRSLNRFLQSRVLFLGDAAHIHSPVGGQGLNTGVQDAYNAAWKVALVGRGIAGWELLTTYDTERRAAVAQRQQQQQQHRGHVHQMPCCCCCCLPLTTPTLQCHTPLATVALRHHMLPLRPVVVVAAASGGLKA